MHDETSIQRQLQRETAFVPPYCPRSTCKNHFKERARPGFAGRHGSKKIVRFPYLTRRFQCKDCDCTFVASFFRLQYRQKTWGHNEYIWKQRQKGITMRDIAREIGHDERLVRTRLRNMSRWCELKHAKLTQELKLEEAIVYDGLENFAYSQYDPNNINHAVGKNTLFIYDFNFCPLNRKGRMSGTQIGKKKLLENKFGKYPTDAIRTSTKRVFERLLQKGKLLLFSDNHYQYRRVVEIDLAHKNIEHIKISSKIYRNFRNHLFAVNNIDLQARQNLAAFKRETISFAKHEIGMLDSFTIYAAYRNYMRPKFWGTHRSDPLSSKRSPAMELGLTKKILSFDDFFDERILPTQVTLNEDARARYDRQMPTSRRSIALAPAI